MTTYHDLDATVLFDGDDVSQYVVSIKRESHLKKPPQSFEIEMAGSFTSTPYSPFSEVQIYEEARK
jgi:hypothetical protein